MAQCGPAGGTSARGCGGGGGFKEAELSYDGVSSPEGSQSPGEETNLWVLNTVALRGSGPAPSEKSFAIVVRTSGHLT